MLFVSNLQGQNEIDSLMEALPEAKDTLRLQAIDKILTKVRGTDKELAQRLVNEEYELARIINDDKFTAEVHNSNGIFKYFQNELDSSIYYFEKSLQSYERIGNVRRAAYLNNNIGILYEQKGDFETAIKYHLASLKVKEENGDLKGVATSKFNIANIWIELGDYKKAKELYRESQKLYEELELENEINDVIYGLAAIATNQDSTHLALRYYSLALDHYKKINDQYQEMSCYNNIGQSHYTLNQLDSALYYYTEALSMANQFEDNAEVASLSRHIGDVYSAQGRHQEAVALLKESVEIYNGLGFKDQLSDSYQYLYEAQEKAGLYEEAYNNFHNYILLRDSIASKKMQTDIVELETKYESEKKEKELVISQAENERKQSRIQLLGSGIAFLLIIFPTLIYALRQKMKRNKIEKEKVLLELKEAEQELDFKKKELTAKVLQLAAKNEFLLKLQEDVNLLHSSIDSSVSKASNRISRMIQHDSMDESEWDQFASEFSSVHQGFVDRLTEKYGTLSANEVRLASLLKMNLSSKEIANILRISDEGIKKARYRLRKKMGLASGNDLQGIILSL